MYLTAEQLAIANQAIMETFEHTSVAWQAIPHWDTGDPSQSRVPAEDVNAPVAGVLSLKSTVRDFEVTLAVATAPTIEALLSKVIDGTVTLAAEFDKEIILLLRAAGTPDLQLRTGATQTILDDLIDARGRVEKEGFRAPSCLITNTAGLKFISQLDSGQSILNSLLDAATINSVHRVEELEDPVPPTPALRALAILVGRRHRIAHGAAADASPGEEPVDLVVSVPPSLEVVGENGNNQIAMTIRVRYVLRVKDKGGLVTLVEK
jgi:hypothetical protein